MGGGYVNFLAWAQNASRACNDSFGAGYMTQRIPRPAELAVHSPTSPINASRLTRLDYLRKLY
jgi:hypothetical protein